MWPRTSRFRELSNERLRTVTTPIDPFSDPEAVARYAEGPPKFVPGYASLQTMARLLIAERAGPAAKILVLGAGGGLETKAFAQAHPGWTFDGVDPSAEMLDLAVRTLGPLASRVQLHQGYVDRAPSGFDAAACLLTFHFIPLEERRRTAREVRRRLKPGSPFVVAHFSVPQGEGERALWLSRHAAYLTAAGLDAEKAANARTAIDTQLSILTPEQDESVLREAGFTDVSLFYASFTFRGWVAYA